MKSGCYYNLQQTFLTHFYLYCEDWKLATSHFIIFIKLGNSSKNAYRVCKFALGSFDINALLILKNHHANRIDKFAYSSANFKNIMKKRIFNFPFISQCIIATLIINNNMQPSGFKLVTQNISINLANDPLTLSATQINKIKLIHVYKKLT